ncbi:MAG TPA: protein-L-isoaspartate(D-aspartate) O-methyltransferase [Thermoanaerobaculia bacterium]|jgi:protein-L-isoaspartate(D-aspartate) O-methyltransferase|nr:protein-L-isoaspartate(D-aspartate) O-methyltransferase [Thermoanaerobaculia bacterium]
MSHSNERMIRDQIAARGVTDPRVLDALRSVPRDLFVPPNLRASAYDDTPLPLGRGQTISQPYIVAVMTELLRLRGHEKVLEIGTGSGYQTAVLARLCRAIYSAEVEPELAETASERLAQLGITNVVLGVGNGVEIFREHAPFDAILSAAAPEVLPEDLVDQLAEGGRCVIPVGAADLQYLWLIERVRGEVRRTRLEAVRFVPLRERA